MEHQGKDFMACDYNIDEVFMTINGKRHYLWRAVDQDDNVLDILVRSCTSPLRIIPSARESGTIPPFHHRARGLCHDSTPFFLPVGGLGLPVAVCHAARCLAQPMHDGV